jgi:hypothetical protein
MNRSALPLVCGEYDLVKRVAYFARLGITIEGVMIDNGSCYRRKHSRGPG